MKPSPNRIHANRSQNPTPKQALPNGVVRGDAESHIQAISDAIKELLTNQQALARIQRETKSKKFTDDPAWLQQTGEEIKKLTERLNAKMGAMSSTAQDSSFSQADLKESAETEARLIKDGWVPFHFSDGNELGRTTDGQHWLKLPVMPGGPSNWKPLTRGKARDWILLRTSATHLLESLDESRIDLNDAEETISKAVALIGILVDSCELNTTNTRKRHGIHSLAEDMGNRLEALLQSIKTQTSEVAL